MDRRAAPAGRRAEARAGPSGSHLERPALECASARSRTPSGARSSERRRGRGGTQSERPLGDAHGRTDPSPGTNGGLWWNGTRLSQSLSACQWMSAVTCSGCSG